MRTMKTHSAAMLGAVALTLGIASRAAADPVAVDAKLAPYKVVSGVSGSLSSVGSDTLNNLMTFWSEKFNKFFPNVKMQVEGKGSSTAPPAMIAGTSQLSPMSRTMKNTEIDDFEKKFGYKPTPVRVAVDRFGIGVSGIGYASPGLRAIRLSKEQGGACVEPDAENAYSGKYPIARFLYIYVNKPTDKPLEPLTREFMKMVLSKEGQEEV